MQTTSADSSEADGAVSARTRRLVITGLMLALALPSLDLLVVATAGKAIRRHRQPQTSSRGCSSRTNSRSSRSCRCSASSEISTGKAHDPSSIVLFVAASVFTGLVHQFSDAHPRTGAARHRRGWHTGPVEAVIADIVPPGTGKSRGSRRVCSRSRRCSAPCWVDYSSTISVGAGSSSSTCRSAWWPGSSSRSRSSADDGASPRRHRRCAVARRGGIGDRVCRVDRRRSIRMDIAHRHRVDPRWPGRRRFSCGTRHVRTSPSSRSSCSTTRWWSVHGDDLLHRLGQLRAGHLPASSCRS